MDILPLWTKWLMVILIVLLLLMMIWLLLQRYQKAKNVRRRAKTYVQLLESRIELLQDTVSKLEEKLKNANEANVFAEEDKLSGKKVFISYSSKDAEIAKALRQLLTQKGIPSFMAPSSIPPGSNYTEEIPDAICGSFAMVVILSEFAQDSKWVPKEIDMALEENVPIIPYQIDLTKLNRQFRFMLGQCQFIQWSEQNDKANQELIARLKALQSVAD